jgi:hypothetical protein
MSGSTTFEDIFKKHGFIPTPSTAIIDKTGVVIPPEGSSIADIAAAGNGGGFQDQNLNDAWKLLSVYRATTDGQGAAVADYLWMYNSMSCHFYQRANSIVVAGGELSTTSSEASSQQSLLEEDRKKFRQQKNRLITLISKNKNIASKYQRSYLYTWILFIALMLYVVVMSALISNMTGLEKSISDTVVLSVSSVVLCIILFFKIYSSVMSLNMEGFTEPSNCPETITDPALVKDKLLNLLDTYLSSYKILSDYNNLMGDSGTVEQRKIIQTILKDYNNVNYVNMRKYQLTDYRLESVMHKRRFVMYGFMLMSMIGLLSVTLADSGPMSGMFPTIASFLVGMYLVTYLLYVRQNMSRKRYNWNKLYWVLNKGEDDQ